MEEVVATWLDIGRKSQASFQNEELVLNVK
jgi:hypothetical protein